MKGTKYPNTLLSLLLLTSIACLGVKPLTRPQSTNDKFMTISDIHLNEMVTDAASFGCDTTEPLYQYAMAKFDSLISEQQPRFILYLGDLPVHGYQSGRNCAGPSSGIHGDIGSVLAGLREQAIKHNVPLLYLFGNNDGYAGDYTSFTDNESGTPITPYDLDSTSSGQWPVINGNSGNNSDLIINKNTELGYYSAYPLGKSYSGKNLRVLMLNSVIFCCGTSNSHNYTPYDNISQTEAANTQMNWISDQLADAKLKQEAVLFGMHVPPGQNVYDNSNFWNQSVMYLDKKAHQRTPVLNAFIGLVQQYSPTVVGLMTSHTHMDELKAFFDSAGKKVIELAVSTPGVTVNHGNNPGMKVYEYDSNYELLDFTTFYAQPYQQPDGEYTWHTWGTNSYTFSEQLGCNDGETMVDCMNRLSGGTGSIDKAVIVNALDSYYKVMSPKSGSMGYPNALDVKPVN